MGTRYNIDLAFMTYYTYMVRCADGTLYSGYAVNLEKRVSAHNGEGAQSGAKYTRARRPVTLVFVEKFEERSDAMKREAALKKLSRSAKEELLKAQQN